MPELANQPVSACMDNEDKGTLLSLRADNRESLSYHLFLPNKLSANSKIMVCVHGISRNNEEQVKAFSTRANQHDYIIIAPYYSKKNYHGYQRLEVGAAGYTPAEALHLILGDVQEKYAVNTDKFTLFGYSGGAQFAHRYALFYPHRINRLVICAAGWFTFPDENENYPYGLKHSPPHLPDIQDNLTSFLRLPITALVGEFDSINDDGLNRKKRINRQQGYHRLDRAKRWLNALQNRCTEMELESDMRFITIRACGHSFEACERLGDLSQYLFTSNS